MLTSRWFYLLVFAVASSALFNCAPKPHFSQWELSWINIFNEGDTLVFKSETQELDTSYIVKKEIFHRTADGETVEYGVVWYKNKMLKYNPDGDRLLTLVKNPEGRTSFSITYLYSTYIVAKFEKESMEHKIEHGSLIFFDTTEDGAKDKPKALYWDIERGLVKYITHDDVAWERIK